MEKSIHLQLRVRRRWTYYPAYAWLLIRAAVSGRSPSQMDLRNFCNHLRLEVNDA